MSATGKPAMAASGKAAMAAAAAGFTLIEMLVVLGIAGLIAGLGFPQLRGQIAAQEWRSSVAGTLALLRSARATAIRSGRPTRISAAPNGPGLRLNGRDSAPLPASVRAELPRNIDFASDGSSTGGDVIIIGKAQAMRISVAPATGLLRARPA